MAIIENTPIMIPDKVRNALSLLAFKVLIEILNNSDIDKLNKLDFNFMDKKIQVKRHILFTYFMIRRCGL